MNLRQIEVFRAVMDTGSMTDAARLLHVSQPGVSRLIRHLELRLGVTLFERRKGRLAATPEAHTLHAEIDRVYRGVKQVQDVAEHLRHGTARPLRIVASANVSLQVVPRAIAALVERFDQARVSFEVLPAREIAGPLVLEEMDVAITSAAPDHPLLEVREIGRWSLVCALPRKHPLARARSLTLDRLLRERLVLYGPDAPQSRVIDAWMDEHGIARRVAVDVRSGYAACSMAAAGAGVAFVDDLSARAHRTEGLVFRSLPRAAHFPICSVVPAHRPLSALGKQFLALARIQLRAVQQLPLVGA